MSPDSIHHIFQSLLRYDAKFVVIGGHAVNVHGYLRTTEDVDILFLRTEDNESRLLESMSRIRILGWRRLRP